MAHEGITSEQAIALSKALDRHTDDSQLAQFAIISFINWMVEINAGHLLQTTNGWSHKDSHSGEFVEHGDWRMTIDIRRDLSYREKEASDEGDSILRLIEESHSWPNITAVQRNGIYASIWFLLVGRSGRTRYSFGLAVQAGVDIPLSKGVYLNLDLKKVYIRTDVSAAGAKLGTFKVDPVLFGVGVGWRF